MRRRDQLQPSFPFRVTVPDGAPATPELFSAVPAALAEAFSALERAIGDLTNTENATGPLADRPVQIANLARAIGPMSALEPVLQGLDDASPALARRMTGATYNVLPAPDQAVRCEIGCIHDRLVSPSSTARSCAAGQTAYYRQRTGSSSGICQTVRCPKWSGRDGQKLDASLAAPSGAGGTYRRYKVVLPTEQRTVTPLRLVRAVNCGTALDRYRVDGGASGGEGSRSDPTATWAQATWSDGVPPDGTSEQMAYEFPSIAADATRIVVVVETPAIACSNRIRVGGGTPRVVEGTTAAPTRTLFEIGPLATSTALRLTVEPTSATEGALAAISRIWVLVARVEDHPNRGLALELPAALAGLAEGTTIPDNFVLLYDTDPDVNQVVPQTSMSATRFTPGKRDAFDVLLVGDRQLEVGHDRYLAVTTGFALAEAIGGLLEAFVEHVTDPSIHLSAADVCTLLADRTACCEGTLKVSIARLVPAAKFSASTPATYLIEAFLYGGNPPYQVTVDWGDGSNDAGLGLVDGVQTFTLSSDVPPTATAPARFQHTYTAAGAYPVTFDVLDNPDLFGCTASLTAQVSPFNVGRPPVLDLEVRLDDASAYPDHLFENLVDGSGLRLTPAEDWDSAPTWNVLTQVHNRDAEDAVGRTYAWILDNPEGLTFSIDYEDVLPVTTETLAIAAGTGTLAETLIQPGSLVLQSGTTLFEEGTDFSVNWETGVVTVIASALPDGNYTALYCHYHNAATAGDVPDQWVTLAEDVSALQIDLAQYTAKTDINTIRIKIKEG